ncbi:MAG TPA: efflux RND transporter permease subunit, partial [Candidatus Eisenbacteria bacterium]|nr:efflux RND transporter permease subunit [Candidatus Eisenbacteria bacterium]
MGIFLFGIISLNRLPQELFPPITYPQLSIVTPYANAAPEEIETLITKPIEEAVGGIAGLRKVTSTSREGLSLVVVEFGWNQSMDFASLSVREKIDLIKERLPRDASEPVVIKFNPFELPVMTLSVSSSERSGVQLRELSKKWFKDEIEKVNGVASASLSGGAEEQILVNIDQAKLRNAGVAINEVNDSISKSNLNYPGGTIKESFYEYLVRTLGEFRHLDEVYEIPIRRYQKKDLARSQWLPAPQQGPADQQDVPSNKLVYLKDVAEISRTTKERTSYSRFNGRENVTIAVQKQATGNAILVAAEIRKKLKELQEQLPKDIHVDIISDQSKFINEALHGVSDSAIQGGELAFLVLLIFLKDFRCSMLVVTITPVTVLATYTLMFFMGISLNVISLGGLALGVGMLLDNAVCVIENIFRKFSEHPEEGLEKATQEGSEEVMAPMAASTLTTVSVFLPIVFVTGIAGQIFKQLAWVVVVTQVVSAIIAFTLLPMLIAKTGVPSMGGEGPRKTKWDSRKGPIAAAMRFWLKMYHGTLDWFAKPLDGIAVAYSKLLPAFIRRKWTYLAIIFSIFFGSLYGMSKFEKILLPKVDQGQFMVKIDMPVGSVLERTNTVALKIEDFVSRLPETKAVSCVVGSARGDSSKDVVERLGSHQAQIVVALKDERERGTDEVVQDVREYFEFSKAKDTIRPARLSYVLYDSAFKTSGDNDAPVVIEIKGPKLDELQNLAESLQDRLSKIEGIYGVTNSIAEPFPETKIIINKDRASYYRLSATQIAQAANIAIKGITASKFKEEGREIDIRVQVKEKDRDRLYKIGLMTMHTPGDIDVPLGDFVKFQTGKGPSEIKRVAQERTVHVYAKVFGRSMKEINDEVMATIAAMHKPSRYNIKLAGESEEIKDSFDSLTFAFMLSIVLVYMIMAAQFESLWQPFLIMFCVPLSLIGVAFALWVSHTPLSVVVILGIILLAGIVVNNGIILID